MDDRNTPPIDDNNENEELISEGVDNVVEDQTPDVENIPSEGKSPEGEAVSSRKTSGKGFEPLAGADPNAESKQRRLFKKTRAGVTLSREEVKSIKKGRRKLRKELRLRGIKSRKEFELTAAAMGLYFDKNKRFGLLLWLFHGRGLWALLGALLALLAALFAMSAISRMQGHYTINMSDDMFREGFLLSETVGFENPTTHLFAQPAESVPCVSITDIPADVHMYDGQHNGTSYFACTYYIRNEGENPADYEWTLKLNSESLDLSSAVWVMLFEDDEMKFYAKPNKKGGEEALPAYGDDTRGYIERPLYENAADAGQQYQLITTTDGGVSYYRIVPYSFADDFTVTSGKQLNVVPHETHKYTVVIWLEGDDPDCTDELIGGHAGMEMQFQLVEEEKPNSAGEKWSSFWNTLRFWE